MVCVTVAASLVLVAILYRLVRKLLKIPWISDIESRYILITGCDTGFGNAAAKKLDAMGCNVIAACLTESGETELKKSCSNKLKTVHLDVSKPESVRKAFNAVVGSVLPPGKGLWGLVNNAGIVCGAIPSDWMDVDEYHKTLGVNFFGLIDVTMTFLPLIKKAKGRIVNTASIAGRMAFGGAPYCASKYGVEAFSDVLRREMRPFKLSVSIVEPSFFQTPIVNVEKAEESLRQSYEKLPSELKLQYGDAYVEQTAKKFRTEMTSFPEKDLSPVVDAYTHGLFGRFPCARYLVGRTAWMFMVLQALPEWISDAVFASRQCKINSS